MRGQTVIRRFGASVRNLRFRLGISQEELADRADLHRTYIAGVEGGTRNITLKSIEKLAGALQVSIADLLSEEEQTTDGNVGKKAGHQPIDILMVEDNPDDVALTLNAFRAARIANRLHVVADGGDALNFLFRTGAHVGKKSEKLPQVILLDLSLPKVGGLEVLRRLKQNPETREIPVIVLTVSRESSDITTSRKLGASSYIVKPINFQNFSKVALELSLRWALLEAEA